MAKLRNKADEHMAGGERETNPKSLLMMESTQRGRDGGWGVGTKEAPVVRSTGRCMEVMNHRVLPLKPILYCMLTN